MQIRLMTKDDAGDIAQVLNKAIGQTTAHFGTVPTNADRVIEDWHQAKEVYPWLVARDEQDEFMGFAKGSAWKTREAYRWTVETGIYLTPGAQGKGIGKALYSKLFELLTGQGFRMVITGVSLPNDASVGLHESFGMEAVGEISPAGYKLGQWVPVRLYQKQLGVLGDDTIPGALRAVSSVWEELNDQ